jgi:hypothetical protein
MAARRRDVTEGAGVTGRMPEGGRRKLARWALPALLAAAAAGCTQMWLDSGAWDLGGHRGLLLEIRNYYQYHATEEGGQCRAPILDGVTAADVRDTTDGLIEVDLRYAYRDFVRDGDDCDWLRCGVFRECTGYAARSFTLEPEGEGYTVIEMSGGRRR